MNIIRADIDHVDQVSPLFDLYRQFYKQAPNPADCRRYLMNRLERQESIIFLAISGEGRALGFTQLYATFCSVELIPRLVLYDLFVESDARRRGIAKRLMDKATEYAKDNGYRRLTLETAIDNIPGQTLYEREGWTRDNNFYTYHLPIN
ncbi:MAG: GNAT family N-acetyltransferase [Pseudomonadales bacterium]|jgi:ribosomal protein S18 acetylase RimI-like enzyme